MSVNIAGLGTATHVYLSVRVDADDTDHELFSEDWTSTGAKLDAVDTHSGAKSAIFDLLKDGAAHTFYFLFWSDAASQATIDVVQLWEGVGSCATNTYAQEVLAINHKGFLSGFIYTYKLGTGTVGGRWRVGGGANAFDYRKSLGAGDNPIESLLANNDNISLGGTVATDLNYISFMDLTLRSQQ